MSEPTRESAEPVRNGARGPLLPALSQVLPPDPDESPGESRRFRLVRLASWTAIDQVLSALTNTMLAIVVAHYVDVPAFGTFAVAILVFNVCIGIERALVGQPMSIRYSSATGARLDSGRARAFGTALAVGLIGALGCIAVGLVLGGQLGPVLVATGAVLPFLLLQDAARLIFFARSQAKLAALNDALWAAIQFPAIVVLAAITRPTPPALVLVWGASAAVCVVVALVQLRVVPDLRGAASWLREHRDLSGYLLAEYLLGAGAFQGGILAVGALVGGKEGLTVVGAFKAAQVVLGPLNMLGTALQTFALPQLSKRTGWTSSQRTRIAYLTSLAMAAIAVLYGSLLLLLPAAAGQAMFRGNWAEALDVLLPMIVGNVFWGLWQGHTLVIYAMGLARRAFWIMAIEAPLVFPFMIGGLYLGGARGAAWGLCLDQATSLPLWLWTFRRVMRESDRHETAAPASSDRLTASSGSGD